MIFALAWTRVVFFLLSIFTIHVHAREDSLFTSSVTYCNPPETLLVQHFQVEFYPRNQSVSFNLSVASVESNVNVTANLLLNVYGMQPLNLTVDLCTLLDGALCPLPAYNFTGADSIILPDSLGITELIPTIAFKIPDLEGYAQLMLTEVGTGEIKACVQATLANGWSAHQSAVEWGTGGAAIAILIVSTFMTLFAADATAPFRFMELMYLFQAIASSALLSLNYPSVYRAYALNFAWSLGLFPTSESSDIQGSINRLRHRTGSQLADTSGGSVVQFVNRRLSPYNNDPTTSSSSSTTNGNLGTLFRRASSEVASTLLRRDSARSTGEVQTVTAESENVLQAGLPIYVNSVHVSTPNAFMTVFLCGLMLFGLVLALLALGYGISFLINRQRVQKQQTPFDYLSFARSWILRITLIALGPLMIFIFYQWTLKDSWATVLLSVLTFLALLALVGYPIFVTIRLIRQSDPFGLYTPKTPCLSANGPLYAQYRPPRFYFFASFFVSTFLRAVLVAFAKQNPEAQVGLLIAIEVVTVVLLCWQRPYHTKGGDVFAVFLALVRLVCAGLTVAFIQNLAVKPIPRVVIGIVIAVIFSVAAVIVVINFILNIGIQRLWTKRTASGHNHSSSTRSESDSGSQGSILEKGMGSASAAVTEAKSHPTLLADEGSRANSTEDLAAYANVRPHNPTPTQSTPIDAHFLAPFPVSPTGSTVTSLDPPSLYSSLRTRDRDSGTLTVGSLLSRRWSFSYSQPNSPSGSSVHGFMSSVGHGSQRESVQMGAAGASSPAHSRPASVGHSRPVSEAWHSAPTSPSAWRPPSSSGSSANGHGGSGNVTRQSSVKAMQQYQQKHGDIPEHETS